MVASPAAPRDLAWGWQPADGGYTTAKKLPDLRAGQFMEGFVCVTAKFPNA